MRWAALIALAAVGVIMLAGTVTWLVAFRDRAEPVTVDEAVTSFRTETEPTPVASPIPEGVYVYGTRGYEQTDALTGVTHRYPKRSTITVAARECGVSLTWRVLQGRSTEWLYCTGPHGWELRSQDERHTFFGTTERTTYVCDDTLIRPARAPVGSRWQVSCTTDGADETGSGTVVARRRRSLRGGAIRTEELIRTATRLTGDIRGVARHDLWFDAESGVPVSIAMVSRTTNASAVGDVHYEEDVTLILMSLTPRR